MISSNRKKILVAGAGFPGVNLCRNLLEEGHDVICLDKISGDTHQNLEYLSSFKHFSILDQDITHPLSINVDEIYNMTCVTSPAQNQRLPFHSLFSEKTFNDKSIAAKAEANSPRSTIRGTANLLNLAVAKRAKIFQLAPSGLFKNISTQSDQDYSRANVIPIGARENLYSDKKNTQAIVEASNAHDDITLKIGCMVNTYGPHMQARDGHVISNFIVQALLQRPIVIYGDGSETRSFCYIDDLIKGIRSFMASSGNISGPIHFASSVEYTMLELAKAIIAMTGSSSAIEFQPLPQDDAVKKGPDNTPAKQLLGWEPRVSLNRGLLNTIQYFDELLRRNPEMGTSRIHPMNVGGAPLLQSSGWQ